jgi:hypothetical protein
MLPPVGEYPGSSSSVVLLVRCVTVPPSAGTVWISKSAPLRFEWNASVLPLGAHAGRPSFTDDALFVMLVWPWPSALALKTSLPWPVELPLVKRW